MSDFKSSDRIRRAKHEKNYTTILNATIQDSRLSWKARGLHHYILSLPNDWHICVAHLAEQSEPDGEAIIKSALKELEVNGYITKTRLKDERGRFLKCVWDIYESPQVDFQPVAKVTKRKASKQSPQVDFPQVDKPQVDKPQVDKPQVDKPQVDKPQVDKPQVENRALISTNKQSTYLPSTEKASKKEKNKETFFSDLPDQNQEAMQELKSSVAIANQEDPTPLPPAPLSDAAIALKAKFEAKFDRKANKYEPQGLTIAGYGEWHLGDHYNNWKPSLIAVAQKRKRDANQTDTPKAATDYIYNMARDCYRELHWGKFENLISDAVEYEKALAANPTQSQDAEPTEPIIYDHDCRWEHYYPMTVKANPDNGNIAIVWGMINTHPPDPVDERCQKFLAKANGDTGKLAKLLTAKHLADSSFASYPTQAENFANAKDGLIAALNQEIQKSLLQAA